LALLKLPVRRCCWVLVLAQQLLQADQIHWWRLQPLLPLCVQMRGALGCSGIACLQQPRYIR
jgi:hypothetical protein